MSQAAGQPAPHVHPPPARWDDDDDDDTSGWGRQNGAAGRIGRPFRLLCQKVVLFINECPVSGVLFIPPRLPRNKAATNVDVRKHIPVS
jgi:hypothetical protein